MPVQPQEALSVIEENLLLKAQIAQLEAAIAARPTLEDALNESEARYQSVLMALHSGVVMQSADGIIHASNASAERMLGLTRDQLYGRTSVDPRWRCIHEDGSPFPGEQHPAMVTLRTGQPCSNVVMGVYTPDESLTWIMINSEPLLHAGSTRPYAVVSSFTDITKRMQLELERETLIVQLDETLKRTDALYMLTTMVNNSQELSEVLQIVVESAANILPAYRTVLITFNIEMQTVTQQIEGGPGALHVPALSFTELLEGLSGAVLRESKPVLSLKGSADPRESLSVQQRRIRDQAGSILVVPIQSKRAIFGTLTAINATSDPDFTQNDLHLLAALTNQAAIAIERAALLNELQHLATIDGLTQLLNRRAWSEQSRRAMLIAQRSLRPVSLIMLDADHFKLVNDTYGHDVGDQVLQAISSFCQQQVRIGDLIGRYGGEEFVILLPETDSEGAMLVAERIRTNLANYPIVVATFTLHITISLGVATMAGKQCDLAILLEYADHALYEAKQAGRNQARSARL